MEITCLPFAEWFRLDVDIGLLKELSEIIAKLSKLRVSYVVWIVNPVPGKIFHQNRRYFQFFGYSNAKGGNIANDKTAVPALSG